MPPHVLVLFNAPTLPLDHMDAASEHEIVETKDAVITALSSAGWRISQLGVTSNPQSLVQALTDNRPNVVFNLFEGIAEQGETEAYCAGLLEWLQIPYTGCPFRSMVIARDKPRAKRLLQGAGLPTPPFMLIDGDRHPACTLRWPVILKPSDEDASVGLDQGSVVRDATAFAARVRMLLARFRPPILAEEFIAGREFNVALIACPDVRVLPISEIVFTDQALWPIVTYEAKWNAGSREDLATLPRCPADVPPALAERLEKVSRQAFALFGCRDYARFDFRVAADGQVYLLEVNPNPDFSPTAGLARALVAGGISYDQFTCQLVERALRRRAVSPIAEAARGR